jgi:hypothetical protein
MSQDKSLYKNAIGVRLITKGKTILKTEPLYDPRQQYQRRFDQYSSDALKVDKKHSGNQQPAFVNIYGFHILCCYDL